jgi:hypothetical protein
MREALKQELLGVGRQRAHAGRMADQPPGEPAANGAVGEAQDLRAVEREDEALGSEGGEELQQHHRQHGARLRDIDRGVSKLPAVPDELARQPDLANEVVRALERHPPKPERPRLVRLAWGGLGPDLYVVSQVGGGPGDLLGERGYPPADRIELMGDEKEGKRRSFGMRGAH